LAVRIRLSRVGATKRPSYRVVAIDSRRPRDGRALEILGFYDPLTKPATVQINAERLAVWVGKGALPSDTVAKLIKLNGSAPSATPAADAAPPKPKRSRKATAKATAAAAPVEAKAAAPEPPAVEPAAEAEHQAPEPEAEAAEAKAPEPEAEAPEAEAGAQVATAEATE
jgi:small subunit ribosomal protein S16